MPKTSPKDFISMAKRCQLADNPLFLSALETYKLQLIVIDSIRAQIEGESPTVSKEYVRGRENIYIHPAVRELPRHVDSANKTAALIMGIIKDLGTEPKPKGKLADMMEA